MPLRGPAKQHRDPIYSSAGHRANIRYWRLAQQPCHLCGLPINYAAKSPDPWSLEVDHIIAVAIARARGWTDEQINDLSNTRPAHRKCNNRRGLQLGAARAHAKQRRKAVIRTAIATASDLDKTRDW